MTREELEERLDEAKRAYGAALVDGKKFNSAEIDELERKIEAYDLIEQERLRRVREQDPRDAEANQRTKIKRLVAARESRLKRWAKFQEICQALREEALNILADSATERLLHSELSPGCVPHNLMPNAVETCLAGRLGAEMSRMPRHGPRLGPVEWLGRSVFENETSWRSAEEKADPATGYEEKD
jgi:hypothetical protein